MAPTSAVVGLLLITALLQSCGITRSNEIASLPPAQLLAVSDQDICLGLAFNADNANLKAESHHRKLGDCSPDHFLCVSWGNVPGTPEYTRCRAEMTTGRLLPSRTGQNPKLGPCDATSDGLDSCE